MTPDLTASLQKLFESDPTTRPDFLTYGAIGKWQVRCYPSLTKQRHFFWPTTTNDAAEAMMIGHLTMWLISRLGVPVFMARLELEMIKQNDDLLAALVALCERVIKEDKEQSP